MVLDINKQICSLHICSNTRSHQANPW